MVTLSIEGKKRLQCITFFKKRKSRAENPYFIILDIQSLAELETRHKERLCKLRLNAQSILSKRKFNKLFSASSLRCEKLSKLMTTKPYAKERNKRDCPSSHTQQIL